MDETHLYRRIAEHTRQEILNGVLKPGDRLPSVKEMAARWGCTIGTIQHAYRELAVQGLITSRAGQGTRVVDKLPANVSAMESLRRASLVNRAEAFLLEMLTAGYSTQEVDGAVRQALERWRVAEPQGTSVDVGHLRFAGSHDPVISWLASHFSEIAPGFTLECQYSGSLGGLLALADGRADIAGCHLWDQESDQYNLPFVRRFFPGRRVALVTLAHRCLGLLLPPGNPAGITGLLDLQRPGLRFANRQPGSGTRVWLDLALAQIGIEPAGIQGYQEELMTHSAVARRVAEGQADAGIGLEAAARSYGLDFILLTSERYDLVILGTTMQLEPLQNLVVWLEGLDARKRIESFGGYDPRETGQVVWSG